MIFHIVLFRTYQAGNCLFKFHPGQFNEGEGKTSYGDFVKSQKVSLSNHFNLLESELKARLHQYVKKQVLLMSTIIIL